jgi:hypothetical protein
MITDATPTYIRKRVRNTNVHICLVDGKKAAMDLSVYRDLKAIFGLCAGVGREKVEAPSCEPGRKGHAVTKGQTRTGLSTEALVEDKKRAKAIAKTEGLKKLDRGSDELYEGKG